MNPLSILGTGVYTLPTVGSDGLLDFLGVPQEKFGWLEEATGITGHALNFDCVRGVKKNRDLVSLDYAYAAASEAMKNAGVSPKDVDQICLVTCTPNQIHFEADTIELCLLLKLRSTVVWSQVDSGCAGLARAFRDVEAYARNRPQWTALIIASNDVSSFIDRDLYQYRQDGSLEDREAWKSPAIFADAAAAVVLGPGEKRHALGNLYCAQNGEKPLVRYLGGGAQYPTNASTLRKHLYLMYTRDIAVQFPHAMGLVLSEFMYAHKFSPDTMGRLYLHQANYRFIQSFAEKENIPMDRVPHNVDRMGNAVSASTLLLLHDDLQSEEGLPMDKPIAFAVVGAGMVWGGAIFMPPA